MLSTIVSKVANIFSPSESTDAIGLLKNDHRTVEELFEKVKANEDGNNAGVFKKIKAELDTHTHIEETIFYPYMLEKGDKELKKIVQEGIEEHRQAKAFLAELAGLAGTSDKFKAKIKVLMEDIEHHVQEEEGDMFPMVRDQFSSDIIDELGARMSSEKAAFKSSGTRSASKRPAPRSTNKKDGRSTILTAGLEESKRAARPHRRAALFVTRFIRELIWLQKTLAIRRNDRLT